MDEVESRLILFHFRPPPPPPPPPALCLPDLRADAHQLLQFPAVESHAKVALERYSNNEATEIQKMIQALPAVGDAQASQQKQPKASSDKQQQDRSNPSDTEVTVRPSRTNSERWPSRIQTAAPAAVSVAAALNGKGEAALIEAWLLVHGDRA